MTYLSALTGCARYSWRAGEVPFLGAIQEGPGGSVDAASRYVSGTPQHHAVT